MHAARRVFAVLCGTVQIILLLAATGAGAQEGRAKFKPGVVAQAQFVAADIGPPQHAEFQVEAVSEDRVRGFLVGSEGLCHGRFEVEAKWEHEELVIDAASVLGPITARLRSVSASRLKGPFMLDGKRGEMTLTLAAAR